MIDVKRPIEIVSYINYNFSRCKEVVILAENKRKVGRPAEDNPKRSPVTIRLTSNDYSRLKEYSEQHSKTMTQVIMEGIEMVYSKG